MGNMSSMSVGRVLRYVCDGCIKGGVVNFAWGGLGVVDKV